MKEKFSTLLSRNLVAGLMLAAFVFSQMDTYAQGSGPKESWRFYKEIQSFKKTDSLQAVPRNGILFVGSSSIKYWKDLTHAFPNKPVINRGFGGSSIPHVEWYLSDIVFPYKPAQIVFYCGENDLNDKAEAVTPDTVLNRLVRVFTLIRKELPGVQFTFISIKPSISRQKLMPAIVQSNKLIKQFLESQVNTAYVDVYSKMLGANGLPLPDIFIKDNLHMNEKGYAIWQEVLRPYLLPL